MRDVSLIMANTHNYHGWHYIAHAKSAGSVSNQWSGTGHFHFQPDDWFVRQHWNRGVHVKVDASHPGMAGLIGTTYSAQWQSQPLEFVRLARGRSNIVLSDGIKPTPYRAYDISQDGVVYNSEYNWTLHASLSTYNIYKRYGWRYTNVLTSFPFLDAQFRVVPDPVTRTHFDNKLLSKVADRKASIAVNLAEAASTASLITRPLVAAANFTKNIRKGNLSAALRFVPRSAKQAVASAADLTLAYQLGIKPLIGDITAGIDIYQNGFRKAGSFSVDSRHTWEIQGGKREYSGSIHFEVDDPNLDKLTTLGIDNPLSVGWELVPYSFVLDWFIDVGSMLENLTATLGLRFNHGWVTDLVSYTRPTGASVFSFERHVLTNFPVPFITIGGGISSASRAVTATALFASLATR